jgi:hypothetical protein
MAQAPFTSQQKQEPSFERKIINVFEGAPKFVPMPTQGKYPSQEIKFGNTFC